MSVLLPIIVLLLLGVAVAVLCRALRLSPIVGYIALGLGLRAVGVPAVFGTAAIGLLAELGVVFLLFDIGLHFSLTHIRAQASDVFAFGPVQIIFAAVPIALVAFCFGMGVPGAVFTGAILALSSTAVVAKIIAERHQHNCPVGLTATAILVFQDVAAILLLIVAGALDGSGPVAAAIGLALLKAGLAFGATIIVARLLIGPLFSLVAGSRNQEVFTAAALLIVLAAGWATGAIGLSLTLGAFLGGVALSETPYRATIQSEITPFRGLLLGFFFIYIGYSLNIAVLERYWYAVIGVTILFAGTKIATNIAASRVFRWSVPGSTQLGFLLAQGSEFSFVILSLSAVRRLVGDIQASVLVAAVALSMAATPNLANWGRSLAGRMRARTRRTEEKEMSPRVLTAPVLIIGMGRVGRTVADGLIAFDIAYCGVEREQKRLQRAIADGYNAVFGDGDDIKLWESLELHGRKIMILTAPDYEPLVHSYPVSRAHFPQLKHFVFAVDEADAERYRSLGFHAIFGQGNHPGVALAGAVLAELGHGEADIVQWKRQRIHGNPAAAHAFATVAA